MSARAHRIWVPLAALLVLAAGVALWRMPELSAWGWYLRSGSPQMSDAALALGPPLAWFDDYYAVADLGAGAYAIGEPRYGQCNFSYLIVGEHRALLFDTGPGVRDISKVVQALTSLPVLVLPSHLHFDHVGNLARFGEVALPDLPALRRQVRQGRFVFGFYQHLGFVEGFHAPSVAVSQWLQPNQLIDLGGRELEMLSVPGHTPDSVVLYDALANRLYAGDFIYPSEIYAFLPGADLEAYARSAWRMARLLNENSTVYGAHGCDALPRVEVPALRRRDVEALAAALAAADSWSLADSRYGYPRELPVNERMRLLAKFPWMSR